MYILLDDEVVLKGLYSFHITSYLDWDCLQSFVRKADRNRMQINLLLEFVAADNEAASYCQNGSGMLFVGQELAQDSPVGCKALQE
jgi:hypothetical protein